MLSKCVPRPTPETEEGSGHGNTDKAVESPTKALEGMAVMMDSRLL